MKSLLFIILAFFSLIFINCSFTEKLVNVTEVKINEVVIEGQIVKIQSDVFLQSSAAGSFSLKAESGMVRLGGQTFPFAVNNEWINIKKGETIIPLAIQLDLEKNFLSGLFAGAQIFSSGKFAGEIELLVRVRYLVDLGSFSIKKAFSYDLNAN